LIVEESGLAMKVTSEATSSVEGNRLSGEISQPVRREGIGGSSGGKGCEKERCPCILEAVKLPDLPKD